MHLVDPDYARAPRRGRGRNADAHVGEHEEHGLKRETRAESVPGAGTHRNGHAACPCAGYSARADLEGGRLHEFCVGKCGGGAKLMNN